MAATPRRSAFDLIRTAPTSSSASAAVGFPYVPDKRALEGSVDTSTSMFRLFTVWMLRRAKADAEPVCLPRRYTFSLAGTMSPLSFAIFVRSSLFYSSQPKPPRPTSLRWVRSRFCTMMASASLSKMMVCRTSSRSSGLYASR
ncbi:hypothetical protein MPH_13192 [Macrophomina phaseolina MS6]|uniref:Uncharacterized protein n=1 Tax=Macrophomina phaseolina (strain MS6) TaxID=1126212 RepID=K2RI05_MACPH|nr:hypothetical protein MPH_13192 [Macrophomina phaseolina MS6]